MPNQESESSYSKYSKEELEKLLERALSSQEEKLVFDEYTKRFSQELLEKVGLKKAQEKSVSSPTEYSIRKPSPEEQVKKDNLPTNQLLSRQGVDYTQLRDFLASGKWKLADQETTRVMLKAAHREEQGFLDAKSLKSFPSEDLKIVDRLWIQYSKGRFGFSVQKRIYQSLELTGKSNYTIFLPKFLRKSGWYWVFSSVRAYEQLKVKQKTPDGYLPAVFLPLWNRLLVDCHKRASHQALSTFFACILLGFLIVIVVSSSVEGDVIAAIIFCSFIVGCLLGTIAASITFAQIHEEFLKTWVSHILLFDYY